MGRMGRVIVIGAGTALLAGGLGACRLWPTLVVDSTVDAVDASPGDGVCETAVGECTLRAAVQEANARPGADRIELASSASYQLALAGLREDAAATGDLDVTGELEVAGHGSTIDAAQIDRVLDVLGGASLTLRGTTITGGSEQLGGGVRVRPGASALIQDVTLTGNVATGATTCVQSYLDGSVSCVTEDTGFGLFGPSDGGGAALLNDGTVSVSSSTISGNTSGSGWSGCSVFIRAPYCTFTVGGAVRNRGTAGFVNVTISGNDVTSGFGSAIATDGNGVTTLVHATVAGNTAAHGAIDEWLALAWPYGSTPGTALTEGSPQDLQLGRSVVAGTSPLCTGPASSLGSVATTDASCVGSPTDLVDTDPVLGPLADNGGPTRTQMPLVGSPLVDAIPGPWCTTVLEDQRHQPRPAGEPCTIGAVEP